MTTKTNNQTIRLIQEAIKNQFQNLEQEGIIYNRELTELNISELLRPSYSSRVPIENSLKTTINSLLEFGFLGGIFVEENNLHVIDGWQRAEIWRSLGNQTIPCYKISCWPLQERKLHLSLNRQAAAFDPAEFGLEFMELDLVKDFGFTEADLIEPMPGPDTMTKQEKPAQQGLVKLNTLVSPATYDRLREIATAQKITMGEVIENMMFNEND